MLFFPACSTANAAAAKLPVVFLLGARRRVPCTHKRECSRGPQSGRFQLHAHCRRDDGLGCDPGSPQSAGSTPQHPSRPVSMETPESWGGGCLSPRGSRGDACSGPPSDGAAPLLAQGSLCTAPITPPGELWARGDRRTTLCCCGDNSGKVSSVTPILEVRPGWPRVRNFPQATGREESHAQL